MSQSVIISNDGYRPSASVIIATKAEFPENNYDYNLLLIQRTPETSTAENHCVFPGGALDSFDESIEWLKYFKDFGIREQELQDLVVVRDNRPQFLACQGTGCYDRFFKKSKIWARDISLRITAIRETFEEVGILLVRCQKDHNNKLRKAFAYEQEDFDRKYWQRIVHNDASQFLQLCRKLNAIPDLWCLKEWSAWRSPPPAKRKFDSVYYIVALDETPHCLPESSEVELTMWKSPHALLQLFKDKIIWLPTLIFYELSRLMNFRNLQELSKFAYERCKLHGTSVLTPIYHKCPDGMMVIIEGDDAYPSNAKELTDEPFVNVSAIEFGKGVKNKNRIVAYGMHDYKMHINITIDGHYMPMRLIPSNSKL